MGGDVKKKLTRTVGVWQKSNDPLLGDSGNKSKRIRKKGKEGRKNCEEGKK